MRIQSRIQSVQYLRGLAALGVVLCHYGAYMQFNPVLAASFNFGQTGVHVFFLISGFIIVLSLIRENYKPSQFFKFLLKRSIRIDPPYYVTIIITILLFQYLAYISPVKNDFKIIPQQVIAHLLYIIPFTNYHFYSHIFWTLCIEFQFYLLIGIFYFLVDNKYYKICFLILFSLASLINWPTDRSYLVFTYSPIFALGISLTTAYSKLNWATIILPSLLLLLIGYEFGMGILVLLLVTCIIILFFRSDIPQLSFLGDISYSLYLTHFLVIIVVLRIFSRLRINLNQHQLFWLLLEVLAAVLFSYFFNQIIERPAQFFSKKLAYKKVKIDGDH